MALSFFPANELLRVRWGGPVVSLAEGGTFFPCVELLVVGPGVWSSVVSVFVAFNVGSSGLSMLGFQGELIVLYVLKTKTGWFEGSRPMLTGYSRLS